MSSTNASKYGSGNMYMVAMSDELISSKYTISEGVCWAEIQAAAAVRGHDVVVASVTWSGRCSWQHLQETLNLGRVKAVVGMGGGYGTAWRYSSTGPMSEKIVS
jgi:hypothetical protein